MNILGEASEKLRDFVEVDDEYETSQDDPGRDAQHRSMCQSRDKPPVEKGSSEDGYRTLELNGVLGKGCFGTVFACTYKRNRDKYCVKRVTFDPAYYNREIDIMETFQMWPHRNLIEMVDYFVRGGSSPHTRTRTSTSTSTSNEPRESVAVTEYYILMPRLSMSLRQYITLEREERERDGHKTRALYDSMNEICLGVLRGLHHMHSMGVMHRDIKPENVLYDAERRRAVVCDFGSSKRFGPGHGPHTSYVCTRWYRAPELLLSSGSYDGAIDTWAAGCVFVELIAHQVAFCETEVISQLCCIFKLLGIPKASELKEMNADLEDAVIEKTLGAKRYRSVNRRRSLLRLMFPHHPAPEVQAYIFGALQYSPSARVEFLDRTVR